MTEDLLHHIWKFKRFNHSGLTTTNGEALSIRDYGQHNHNAGPDFLNALVHIGKTRWFGHIEIHIKSRDWLRHGHQEDPAYNNVILHVVYEDDGRVMTESGTHPACLELRDRVDPAVPMAYTRIFKSSSTIPCHRFIRNLDRVWINIFLESLAVRRLERKLVSIGKLLEENQIDWETCCYRLIAAYIGGPVNREAFVTLAERVPLALLRPYMNSMPDVEALYFGQSGLLDRLERDEYMENLNSRFRHLKKKHKLNSMTGREWRFGRLRPGSNPCLRIAQLAAIYCRTPRLFRSVIDAPSVKNYHSILAVTASEYWDKHYVPGRKTKEKAKHLGKQVRTHIIINAFIPLLFGYGRKLGISALEQLSLSLYGKLTPEKNKITRMWEALGLGAENSMQSQALIELKTQYCDNYKCLDCTIGTKLLLNVH